MAPLTRILLTVFAVITMIIGVGVYLSTQDKDAPTSAQGQGEDVGQLVRDNSRRLTTVPNSDVTFVEFLDFECEACRAAFPMVEQLRAEYGDRVNFVIRYFPIQSHFNAERAARAVEAGRPTGQVRADVQEDVRDAERVGRTTNSGGLPIPRIRS